MKNYLLFVLVFTLFVVSCTKEDPVVDEVFTIEDEVNLGVELKKEIQNSNDLLLLDKEDFNTSYQYINNILARILSTGEKLENKSFEWGAYILVTEDIDAFSTPDGSIFITTGLLTFLANESELAAIIANEIIYTDNRYNVAKLQNEHGYSLLLDISLGSNVDIRQDVLSTLINKPYAEDIVEFCDEASIKLLCPTIYEKGGLDSILTRLKIETRSTNWENTHPETNNRLEDVQNFQQNINCIGEILDIEKYQTFLASLPQ